MSNVVKLNTQYDLSTCEKEPIHLLGRVQSFGYFIAFNSDWGIIAASENVTELFKVPVDKMLGRNLETLFDKTEVNRIKATFLGINGSNHSERLTNIDLFKTGQLYDLAIHLSGSTIVVELEKSVDSSSDQLQVLKQMIRKVTDTDNLEDLLSISAEHVSTLTGFDRVMVYRFHGDGSGEVVAEHRNASVDSFMGLRYPASDIPRQARALYKRNLTRLIADVHDTGVPIHPQHANIDLSISSTRSVSPVHIEYLKNMGVAASMSISILVDGELWGLFACHHYSNKYVSLCDRTIAELYVESLALELRVKLNSQSHSDTELSRQLHMKLVTSLNNDLSLFDNLKSHVNFIHKLIPSDSMVLVVGGEYQVAGDPISSEDIQLLVKRLNHSSQSGIFSVESLQEWLNDDLTIADRFAGMLVVPMSRRPKDLLIFLRKEEPQKVSWAGNPEKPVELGPNGIRLTPRKSFEAWIEMRKGYSAPWTDQQIALAEQIKTVLLEIIVRNLDDYNRIASEAQSQKDMLIHELNHRVRNILGLISGIVSQTSTQDLSIKDFQSILGGRVQSLAIAQTHLTEKNWNFAPLTMILDNEERALVAKTNLMKRSGPEVKLSPKAFTTMTMVIHELLTNAVKYGAAKSENGQINLNWQIHQGELHLYWRESGVTIEQSPSQFGFGSVIINRSIPHDLGGVAKIEYQRSGVVAEFVIPAMHFETAEAEHKSDSTSSEAVSIIHKGQPDKESVLIVEDNMIIGFELERMLQAMGYKNIELAATVQEAHESINKKIPGLAVLDINLGDESSETVADCLRNKSVPFIFATGYSSVKDGFKKKHANVPVVEKPFSSSVIQAAIQSLES